MNIYLKKITSVGLKYGISGGIVSVLFFTVIYFLERNILDPSLTLVMAFVILLFIIFALIEFRQMDKATRFWKNMSVGIIIYLIIGIFTAFFTFTMVKWVDKGLLQDFVAERMEMMLTHKSSFVEQFDEAAFEKALEGVKNTEPHHLAIDRFIKDSMSGLFVTILISAIFHFIYNRKVFTNPKSN